MSLRAALPRQMIHFSVDSIERQEAGGLLAGAVVDLDSGGDLKLLSLTALREIRLFLVTQIHYLIVNTWASSERASDRLPGGQPSPS